ncbi:MAG: hypothetical protein HYU66_04710 [Armatimonadetes bacterium]|nr:hypothetical protein [Armatimonadota bacterium]
MTETAAPGGLAVTIAATGRSDWHVDRVWLLDSALPATEAAAARTVVPFRLGRGMTAAEGLPVVDGQTTYDGASMQMLSLERAGASLLVTWDDVDARYQVRRAWVDHPRVPGSRVLLHSLELWNGAARVHLRPLGKGDYVTAARAYRDVAVRRGWRVTRGDYAKQHPEVRALSGAADFKPGADLHRLLV